MAVCIAIIGKENAPKYIVCSESEVDNELEFHYKLHMSLDIVQEKLTDKKSADLYLGLLYSTEDHKLYGYVTNTKIKFVVVFRSSPNSPRENEIKTMMKDIHVAYMDVVCNPFYIPGETIKSKKFDKIARSMLTKN